MALTRNVLGQRLKAHRFQLTTGPAKAGHLFFLGAIVSVDAEGRLVPGVADGAIRAAGIVVTKKFPQDPNKNYHLDTRNGSDGEWVSERCDNCVEYNQAGEYYFTNIIGSPVVGGWAYVVDDDTVSATPTVEGIILGEFTQNKGVGWYVDVGRKNPGLGIARDAPFDFAPVVFANLAPDSPPVERSDVLQYSLTNRGDLQAGAANGTPLFAGVAAEDAQPGDQLRVWRSGRYPVRIQDGQTLPVSTLLSWENTGVRFVQITDFSLVGITLEESLGGVGEIRMCEIFWPPNLRIA